jgi:DNA-binding NarL/FixJ family response regulator
MPSHEGSGSDFISIVVADGTRIHTQLLADAMRSDLGLHVVASASSSKDLLAAVERVPVDVAVISFALDDQQGRGPELLREMRVLHPQIKGVILLDSSRPQDVLECFRAGAKGIFSKHEKLESLCKCIRCVHDGQIWASSGELEHVLEALANSPLVRATNQKGLDLLSGREREVIQYLAGGMTNREIAKALRLSPHTIKNYLFRIFDKLGVSSRTELLYLTMNNSQPRDSANGNGTAFAAVIEAAEAGSPSAQLRLAEHYSEVIEVDGQQQNCVSAYMWYLLAEKAASPLLGRIDEGKKNISRTMSPQQIAESEDRAAEWLRDTKKQSAFAGHEQLPSEQPRRKMRAGAR